MAESRMLGLRSQTGIAWVRRVEERLDEVLIDHAHCEKKAAGTAMNMLFRYNDREQLQIELTQLAREELLHYEQVRELLKARGIAWRPLSAARARRTLSATSMQCARCSGVRIARTCSRVRATT